MSMLRFLAVVLLALWVGGLATLGLGAPVIFSALESHDPVAGRTLAGIAFGAIFTRFELITLVLGLILIVLLGVRAATGASPRRLGWRMWTIAAMIAASAITTFVITPRIDELRESTPGAIADLADSDARKIAFGRLHGTSGALLTATLLAGLGLVWAELQDGK
jgi:hypothetical protein